MSCARLLILAEERLLGRGLASLLRSGFETHAVESVQSADPLLGMSDDVEIALWLGERLDTTAVAGLEALKRAHPGLRFCLLAKAADADALRPLLEGDTRGLALLYRSGELDVGQLLTSLDEVLAGRSTLEPTVLERLLERDGDEEDALACLTAPEQEVLALVAQGLRNKEIARRVWRSEKAVEKQVGHVLRKLGLDRDTALHLDRRVTAARIFFACRPHSVREPAAQIPADAMARALVD